jgi:hypothetical protein
MKSLSNEQLIVLWHALVEALDSLECSKGTKRNFLEEIRCYKIIHDQIFAELNERKVEPFIKEFKINWVSIKEKL